MTRIDALRTGELRPDELGVVREHLSSCPSCHDSVADVTALAERVRALAATPPRSCREAICDSYEQIRENGEVVWVAFSEDGLRLIHRGGTFEELASVYTKRYGRTLKAATLPEALRKQVISGLEGEGVARPRVDWSADLTDLEREVLELLPTIPRGEVRTYEWIARKVGRPRAVRAVGNILARNAVPIVVPCHRVVPTAGGTGNYVFGSAMKRELLRREGVDIEALDDLSRKGVRYLGSRTTKIVCFPTCRDARRIREENRVPFRAADEAIHKGFRPCRRCQPFVA